MSFLANPLLLFFLTVFLYSLGIRLSKQYKFILVNPIILSMLVLIAYCMFLKIPFEQYQKAGQFIEFLLKPSIVALAIPLYMRWGKIKKQLIPIFTSQLVGCVIGILSVVFSAKLLGAEKEIIYSLAPKSVTTAVALEISNSLGGVPSITAVSVMMTGIFGSMIGFQLMNLSRLTNPVSQGIAMGTSSHAMGTMRAMEVSESYGAFASVGMILNGILTSFLAPLILSYLDPYL